MSDRTPAGEFPTAPAPDGDVPTDAARTRRPVTPRHATPELPDGDGPDVTDTSDGANIANGADIADGRDGADGRGSADGGGSADGTGAGTATAGGAVAADAVAADAVAADAVAADGGDGDGRPADAHGDRVRHWREQSRRRRTERRKRPWWVELPVLVVIAFFLTFLIQTFVARVYYVPSGSMEHTLHGTTNGGDRILAFKMVYDFRGPQQGEVVVFKGPATWTPEADIPGPSTWFGKVAQALGSVVGIAPPNEKDYVKRVIAVGGQTISCCDSKGRVQVDGVSLDEPYLFMENGNPQYAQWEWIDGQSNCGVDPEDPTRYNSIRCFGPYTVPRGTVWVMGDHRPDSADSSYFCRGLVPASNVHCQGPIPVKDVIGKAVAIVMPPSRWGGIASPDIMSSPPGSK